MTQAEQNGMGRGRLAPACFMCASCQNGWQDIWCTKSAFLKSAARKVCGLRTACAQAAEMRGRKMIEIKKVTDPAYRPYGTVVEGYDLTELLARMQETPCPEDGTVYVGSEKKLEDTPAGREFAARFFGGMPIQLGYCNGHNEKLNALEYHRNSEVNVAVTDLILLVGKKQDIAADFTYDTAKVEAFLVPAGTVVQMYETTLHYAPCGVNGKGFRDVIILPRGTNDELAEKNPAAAGEDRLQTHVNKWLIAHPEAQIAGAFAGLKGENITVD